MVDKNIEDNFDYMSKSVDYEAMIDYWEKAEAVTEGLDFVRKAGETYLPKFPDETAAEYNTRLDLTKFTNIYSDVLDSLSSKPFETLVTIGEDGEIPEEMKEFADNVDGASNNITVFASQLFYNGINDAISWIFVDYPNVDRETIVTRADEKAAGIRPYWSYVKASNVLDVKSEIINSEETLTYMRIYEPDTCGGNDHVRVFERLADGTVVWKLMEKMNKKDFVQVDSGEISIGVIPLVPFITGRRDGRRFKFKPPMKAAVDLQVTLYQEESALQFIKTMAGYPMLAANGITPEKDAKTKKPKKLAVGPTKVLYSEPDSKGNTGEWKYVEPSAESMKFLLDNIRETKQDLRDLGKQPLTTQATQLTVITTAVASGKAKSAVQAWTFVEKDALENAFKLTAKWMNIEFTPNVTIFNEFDNFDDGDTDIKALNDARDRGDLSQRTYHEEYKRRKILSEDFSHEREIERMLNEIPNDSELTNENDADDGQETRE